MGMPKDVSHNKQLLNKIKAERQLFLVKFSQLQKEQNKLLADYRKRLEELKINLLKERINKI